MYLYIYEIAYVDTEIQQKHDGWFEWFWFLTNVEQFSACKWIIFFIYFCVLCSLFRKKLNVEKCLIILEYLLIFYVDKLPYLIVYIYVKFALKKQNKIFPPSCHNTYLKRKNWKETLNKFEFHLLIFLVFFWMREKYCFLTVNVRFIRCRKWLLSCFKILYLIFPRKGYKWKFRRKVFPLLWDPHSSNFD